MPEANSFTFYTYSQATNDEDRWADTGLASFFFHDEESAREALEELRAEIECGGSAAWTPMRLERIETLPISKEGILALLNDGVGAFVKRYDVIDIIK